MLEPSDGSECILVRNSPLRGSAKHAAISYGWLVGSFDAKFWWWEVGVPAPCENCRPELTREAGDREAKVAHGAHCAAQLSELNRQQAKLQAVQEDRRQRRKSLSEQKGPQDAADI